MSPNTILLIVVSGILIAASCAVLFSWIFARRWCDPEQKISLKTPADHDMFFEHVRFYSDGEPLSGWFIPAPSRDRLRPAIVLVHGWSSNAAEMLPIASMLNDADFGVFLYDARGHGVSSPHRPITIRQFSEDVIAAIEYMQSRDDVDVKALGVMGHSLGGSAAIVAASDEQRIRSVVSASAFSDPEALTREFMAKLRIPSWPFPWLVCRTMERWLGVSIESIAPRNRIGRITVPLMLIHGDSDLFISPRNLDILYNNADRRGTRRMIIPSRGHSDLTLDPHCVRSAISFFRTSLESSIRVRAPRAPFETHAARKAYEPGRPTVAVGTAYSPNGTYDAEPSGRG